MVHLDGGGKDWRFHRSDAYKPVELAVLDHYHAEGWRGCAAEGGLILTLIKAASFTALPVRHADTFIEALYAKNVAFAEDRFEHSELLAAIERASPEQIERNWAVIAASADDTPRFYPQVQRDHVVELFNCLGLSHLVCRAAHGYARLLSCSRRLRMTFALDGRTSRFGEMMKSASWRSRHPATRCTQARRGSSRRSSSHLV